MKEHKFFGNKDPLRFWTDVTARTNERTNIPYRPNPLKYQYLLSNKYQGRSNLDPPSKAAEHPLYDFEDEMNHLQELDQQLQQQQEGSMVSAALAKANRTSSTAKKQPIKLNNFALQRVNKEFENF